MSGDDDFEGENDVAFWEHFTPVGRSLKRIATSRSMQAYAVSFVGIILLSASIGGAVIGGYAMVQKPYGLCDRPVIDVHTTSDTTDLIEGHDAPNFPHFSYSELSPDERRTFEEALSAANENAKLERATTPHISQFQNGAIVTYHGDPHYVVVESMNQCSPTDEFNFPLSIAGLVVGAGLVVAPGLWRRFG